MWVRRLSRHRFRPMARNVTVYNVFFNDGRDGSSDQYLGTADTEAEAQALCDNHDDGGAWDPYYQIIPMTSGEPIKREESEDVDDILTLAAIIREVDGGNKKGAAALAEAILSHPDSLWGCSKEVSGK